MKGYFTMAIAHELPDCFDALSEHATSSSNSSNSIGNNRLLLEEKNNNISIIVVFSVPKVRQQHEQYINE
jgi:hypothetical protein